MKRISPLSSTPTPISISGQFDTDRDAVIARARENGIGIILTVGCDLPSSQARLPNWLAGTRTSMPASASIRTMPLTVDDAASGRAARAGRTSPRLSPSARSASTSTATAPRAMPSGRPSARQIRLAREVGMPLIVHDRDAHDEVLAILREEKAR